MGAALGLMCKAPRPGLAKTRLAASVGPATAASLARAFLIDSAALLVRVAGAAAPAEAVALFSPADAAAEIAPLLPAGMALRPQAEGDLGGRMHAAFAALFAAGHGPVLLTGTDSPNLPAARLHAMLERLRAPAGPQAVLVPATDGGYCAIGLRAPAPRLFEGIAWSTARVLAKTRAIAERHAMPLECLEPWYDVDEVADLEHLRADLAAAGPTVAPATLAALRALSG